jgi:hypothetical protein
MSISNLEQAQLIWVIAAAKMKQEGILFTKAV